MFKRISLKLGNMRSEQNFTVHMDKTAGTITGQSSKSIFKVDAVTGLGYVNTKGQYFHHLLMLEDLLPVALNEAELAEMHRIFPLEGDKIGESDITGAVYYGGSSTIGVNDIFEARFNALKHHHIVRMLNVHHEWVNKGDTIWYEGLSPHTVKKVMKTKLIATDENGKELEFKYRHVSLCHRRNMLATAEILAAREATGAPEGIEVVPGIRLPYYGNAVEAWQKVHTAAISGVVATALPNQKKLLIEDTRPRKDEPVHDVYTVVYDADTITCVEYADWPTWKAK